jgi:hypothetical protein
MKEAERGREGGRQTMSPTLFTFVVTKLTTNCPHSFLMGTEPMKRKLATRLSKLGTETAYAVSWETTLAAKSGIKVYPFHIGDINIPTPEVFKKGNLFHYQKNFTSTSSCPLYLFQLLLPQNPDL